MRKRFIAFYDALGWAFIGSILFTIAILITIFRNLRDFNNWYYVLIFACCIAIPVTAMFCLQRVTIDLNCDKVDFFYLVNFAKNDRDMNTNWTVHPSQIERVSVVKLTKEEKRKYTSAKFIFSKYLKVEMEYGNIKYIYISHYSSYQIKKIIKLLTSKSK